MTAISREKIWKKNVFTDPEKEIKKVNMALDITEQRLKDIATASVEAFKKINVQDSKGLKKFNDAINQSKKSVGDLDKFEKKRNETNKITLQIAKQIESQDKKLTIANSTRINQKTQLTRLTKEQNAANKDFEIINAKNAGTLEKVVARSRQLRREREKLNLETKKGRDRLKAINLELDKNNNKIKENSSQLEKQKINVGNYSESIKEAAGASGLFGGILGRLTAIQGVLNALTKKSVVVEQADVVAKTAQAAATTKLTLAQKIGALATGLWSKSLKIFKFALASTGIGLLVVALGALIAFFTRSQKGIDFLSVKMAGLGAVVDVIIDAFAAFGEAIFDAFSNPKKIIQDVIEFIKKIPGLVLDNIVNRFKAFGVIFRAIADRDLKALADGFLQLGTGVEDFTDKATKAFDTLGKAAEAARKKIKELADELAEKQRIAERLRILTIDLNREEALFSARQAVLITKAKELNLISRDKLKTDQVRIEALKEANRIEVEIANMQLELAEKSLAASLDGLSADEQRLELDPKRLKFIEDIKNGTISTADAIELSAKFTLSSAKGEEAFKEIIEKIVALEQERQNLLDRQATTIKKLSALQVQVATKNAQALVREATAFRQLAKDKEKSTEDRIELLEQAAVKEIESFKLQVVANIKNERELAAARLQINAKLEADIKALREKGTVGDDKEQRKRLTDLEKLRQSIVEGEIQDLERILEVEDLTAQERIDLINEIFRIRRENSEAQAKFEVEIQGKTAEEILIINQELKNDLVDIENSRVDAVKDANDAILAEDEKLSDKRLEAAKSLAKDITKEFLTELKKQDKLRLQAANDDISRRENLIERLRESTEASTLKSLAFEEAQLEKARLAKQREEERIQKRNEVLALAQIFLNQVQEQSKDNPDTAIAEAFKNTFLALAISRGLAGLYEGTDEVGSTGSETKFSNGRDGYVARLDQGEKVFNKSQSAELNSMGYSDRDDIIDAVREYNAGKTWMFMPNLQGHLVEKEIDNAEVIESHKTIVKAIEDNRVQIDTNWHSFHEVWEKRMKGMQKQTIKFIMKKIGNY